MPNSLYGSATYGTIYEYGGVESSRGFRYACGLTVFQDRYWRYTSLASIAKDRYFRYEAKSGVIKDRYFRYYPNGYIIKSRRFRYAAPQGVTKDRYFRYTGYQGIFQNKRFRYSNSRTMSDRRFRYQAVVPIFRDRRFRYLPITDEYYTIIGGNPSGNPSSGGGGTIGIPYSNPLQGYLYATDTQIPETHDLGLASFGVTFKESEPAQWSLNIIDPTGKYNPDNEGSAWTGVMSDDAYTSGVLTKFIRSALTMGGVPFEFVGVPTQFSYDRDMSSRYFSFTWSGVDRSEALFNNAKTYESYKSRLGSTVTAHQIIGTILSLEGFSGWMDFPDFIVPVMHLQNSKPIEFIKSLIEVMGAEWQLRGENTIHIYLPTQKGGNQNWTMDLSSNVSLIYNHSVESQFPEIYNQVTIARTREVGISTPQDDEDGEGNEMVVEEFGVYTIEFDQPLNGLYYRELEASRGNFNTLIMWDPNHNFVGVMNDVGTIYPGMEQNTGYNVKSVEFNWDANPNVLAEAGYGRIRFFGTTNDSFTGASTDAISTSEFDTTFTVIGRYAASYSKHGPKAIELPPNPLIPTEAVAQIAAREYLRRVFRNRKTIKYKIPLNFLIRPGDTIQEIDSSLSLTRNVYVVEAAHNFSNEPMERISIITAVEYPDDFSVTFIDPDDL